MTLQPFIQQNQIPNEPELKDLLALFGKQLNLNLNCHHVARVESFNSATQQITASIVYKKTFFQPNAATGGYDPVLVNYPVAVDCPAIFLGGGGASLTFPVTVGDECVLLFNDRSIDNWYAGLPNAPVATPRLHAFSDAIALVGIRSLANSIIGFNAVAAELRNRLGTSRVAISDTGVTLDFNGSQLELTAAGMTVTLATGPVLEISATGQFTASNIAGDLVTALYTILTTATAAGFPLIIDPASTLVLASLKP